MLQPYPELESFLNYLRFEKSYSQHTLIAYQNDLENFFKFLIASFDAPSIKTITAAMVRSWMASLKEEEITSKSINRKISSLKSFFKFLMREEIIESTPMSIIS